MCNNVHNNAVIKNESGLEYYITQKGNGKIAAKGSCVTVHYSGYLSENGHKGAQFDSSYSRNTPFSFVLGARQVIAGWEEGVCGMVEGETRTLIIPSALGYGKNGYPGVIPPNATLIFDVTLLEVE